jgi:hypothetical protein
MDVGIIWLLVIVVLSVLIVLFCPEPLKTKLAEIGGVAFMLWILVKLFAALSGGAGRIP